MNTDDRYIPVGKIGSSYGIKGWVKISSFTERLEDVLQYDPWYLHHPSSQTWTPIHVEEGRMHGKGLIAKLSGVNTPEQARQFAGRTIAVTRAQLAPLKTNEYYWSDLEGLTVINKQGKVLGKVVYLLATGSNDVLVIKGKTEFAVPYLPGKSILSVDLAKQEIHIDWEWE